MIPLIKNIIRRAIREPKFIIFIAIFPIVLTLVIGGVIGNMTSGVSLSPKTIYYLNDSNDKLNNVFEYTMEAADEAEEEFSLTFKEITDRKEGIEAITNGDNIFLELNDNEVKLYLNQKNEHYYSYLKSLLENVDKTMTLSEISFKNTPENTQKILSNFQKIDIELLEKDSAPSGFDYYAIAELAMMVLYILLFPLKTYMEDRKIQLEDRIYLSGLTQKKYIIGNTIGYFIVSFAMTLPAFLFSLFVLKTNWGENPIIYLALIQLSALFAIILGTFVIFALKVPEKISSIIDNLMLPIFSFLGGGYLMFPLDPESMGTFGYVTLLSPLRWVLLGIFNSIYNNDNRALIGAFVILTVLSIVMLLLVFKVIKKREVRICKN